MILFRKANDAVSDEFVAVAQLPCHKINDWKCLAFLLRANLFPGKRNWDDLGGPMMPREGFKELCVLDFDHKVAALVDMLWRLFNNVEVRSRLKALNSIK